MAAGIFHKGVATALVMSVFACGQEIITDVSCRVHGKTHWGDRLEGIAVGLVSVKPGEALDTAQLRESVDALELSRLFASVEVVRQENAIVFDLTPARYVRDIRVRRGRPLFESDIEKAMSVYSGDMFVPGLLAGENSLITGLYRREGFISPEIEITTREHRKKLDSTLIVRVDAGRYYRLRDLKLRGNHAVSNVRIKRRMKTWRVSLIPWSSGRFVAATVREDVKAIIEYYRARGFADVEIRDSVETDSASRSSRVVLNIHEGDRYVVRFSRRKYRGYSKFTLRKDIALFESGNRNGIGVKKAVKAMEERMREAGFQSATIETTSTDTRRRRYTERRVKFDINRGSRTTVESIVIRGENPLGEKTVRAQMLLVDRGSPKTRAFNREKLNDDVFSVEMLYRTRGYLKAVVTDTAEQSGELVDITLNIEAGTRTEIGEITVDTTAVRGIAYDKAITVKRGDAYRSDLLNGNARTLQAMIAEKGYPHALVRAHATMNSDSSRAEVEFQIDKGPLVTMGDIHFVGAFRTRDRVLERELRGKRGKPLSLKDMVDAQKDVRDLGLFGSVRFRTIGLREKRDTVNVFAQVAERPYYYGSLGGGYQSDKGPYLNARIGDRNAFGLNKNIWIGGELSRIFMSGETIGYRAESGILEPRLFGSKVRATLEVFGEQTSELNQDWGTKGFGVTSGLILPFARHAVIGLGGGYERRMLHFEDGAAPLESADISADNRPRNILMLTPSFAYDRRDSFTRPRKGVFLSMNVDIAKSLGSDLDNFIRTKAEAKGYLTPLNPVTIATVIRAGYLHPYGSATTVPSDQLFFLGGTRDVRGFAENRFHRADPSGGTATLSGSVEARIEIGFNVELAAFVDAGWLEQDFRAMSLNQFRSSVGGGIRYITPIGPIGILYGLKIGRLPEEDVGAFHFSLGYTF